nr:far upstream element-binding protein 2 [Tanacetum cinerariifolium]
MNRSRIRLHRRCLLYTDMGTQAQSRAKIQVTRDMDADPNSQTRGVELTGSSESIAKAEEIIRDVLAKAEAGGSGIVSCRLPVHRRG